MQCFSIHDGSGVCYLPPRFELELGGALDHAQLGYELQGPAGAPLILVLGGISAGRHVSANPGDPRPGWWEGLVGPGRAIDTGRYRVLGVDYLGGLGASTGPQPEAQSFPRISPGDQAEALALLLDHLRCPRLHRIVGGSFGGMVAQEFAGRLPRRVAGLVCLAAAHEPHPMATAWRGLQRQILELGAAAGDPSRGVALARSLAMTSYRSHQEFAARFAPASREVEPEVSRYLRARGEAFAREFPALGFACLSAAIDLHRFCPEVLQVPTTLIGFDGDQLVPAAQLDAFARRQPRWVRRMQLPSEYGHDGFLKEVEALTPILAKEVDGDV